MASWPTELQQCLETSGYQRTIRDNVLRSQMSYGPAKMRFMTTNKIVDHSGFIYIEEDLIAVLDQFYADNGSIPFDWINFQTGAPATYRFRSAPAYRAVGGLEYTATLQLEEVPS